MTSAVVGAPVRVQARLDAPLNRWLWLVKWLLVIPHIVVLSLLWVGFGVLSVVAFFAILFTGRYPRSLFDFNVGVLRWSWRVAYYAYGALATDRYPPFSLDERPDYPATLDIAYPARLSHGLVLIKWLLALPHLLIVTIFIGGGTYLAAQAGQWAYSFGGGLVGLLAVVAGVMLLFTGRYPQGLFDFILGLDRWVLRVAAYVGLMTDTYPPFRLDTGGADPATATVGTPPPLGTPGPPPPLQYVPPQRSRWSAGGIVAVIVGSLLVIGGLGAAAGGAALLIATTASRGDDGLISTSTEQFSSNGYALQFGVVDVTWIDGGWASNNDWLGRVQVQAEGMSTDVPVFIGIASESDVVRYLTGVQTDRVTQIDLFPFRVQYTPQTGQAPATPPTAQDFWAASAAGVGPQTLIWDSAPGTWVLVVMNADGSQDVAAALSLAADVPVLAPVGWTLVGVGAAVTLLGTVVIVLGALGARRREDPPPAHLDATPTAAWN